MCVRIPLFCPSLSQSFTINVFIFFTIITIHHCLKPPPLTPSLLPLLSPLIAEPEPRITAALLFSVSTSPTTRIASVERPATMTAGYRRTLSPSSSLFSHLFSRPAIPGSLSSSATPRSATATSTFSSLSLIARTTALSASHSDTDDESPHPFLLFFSSSHLRRAQKPQLPSHPSFSLLAEPKDPLSEPLSVELNTARHTPVPSPSYEALPLSSDYRHPLPPPPQSRTLAMSQTPVSTTAFSLLPLPFLSPSGAMAQVSLSLSFLLV
ncbi:uncharacterized protein LOC107639438 [Arachis ipaensis]|uniref:uncharacterized protein LOC107639438 n=1 Tax=Arachis ipaensis TaxID=130454 RepID=UPI0007AF9466|nr:uncharacterized protein LOC107639438 [Arachis ipaensis]XP_025648469.1 uncharacterized protein LOC112743472 [Arachis hypogaea]XP_029147954.1 uncharacterized protein LOC112743472 [Arachis hypogaea]XP_029147955.1 uncharacterized protein LOC112743472 [Arachis hypogaea]